MSMRAWLVPNLLIVLTQISICGHSWADDSSSDSLDEAIKKAVKDIPANSLKLPDLPEIGVPPAVVSDAGPEFTEAWTIYRSVTAPRTPPQNNPAPEKDAKPLVNAHEEPEKFVDLLKRTIEATPPPDLSEYGRFTYQDHSFCADGFMSFGHILEKGVVLALLRHGKTFEALRTMSGSEEDMKGMLLKAFGVDPETFAIGEWLAGISDERTLCKTGGEKTARMFLRWIDLHFDDEIKRRRTQMEGKGYDMPKDEPHIPTFEMTYLLRPDNGVTDATKARIVEFIRSKGVTLAGAGGFNNAGAEGWLLFVPKGAEKWMVPIARIGLEDTLNRARIRASKILKAAGVEHDAPELRPDPRYRILVNGEKWPGRLGDQAHLGFSVDTERTTSGVLKDFRDGIAVCDADSFSEHGKLKRAQFYEYPYVWADIPLPVDYENIVTIDFAVRELVIDPVFPNSSVAWEDSIYAVELDHYEEGHTTDGGTGRRTSMIKTPCLYAKISPGEYWLRVRHPGAVLEDRQRITIKNDREPIRPRLRKGSSLVVPVEWPGMPAPKDMPQELGLLFEGEGNDLHKSLQSIIKIKGDGVRGEQENIAIPEAAKGRFPDSVIFPYLPPGKYTIEAPARTIEPGGPDPGCVIERSSIEVEIHEDSPTFVTTPPIKILYSVKK